MGYKIAIASGKGGTGKTTVSVQIFQLLLKEFDNVILVDCDVEEPNDRIFLSSADLNHRQEVFQKIPVIQNENCTYCRKCAEYCVYNAIVVIPSAQFAEVNASLCHSCGACLVACDHKAITEYDSSIGEVSTFSTNNNKTALFEGRLKVGSSMQTMLIKKLKQLVPASEEILLYDAPPGTSCSVVETVIDADFVILVSEPTPFGLHDLKLAVELMRDLGKSFGVVVNKAGVGNSEIYNYISTEQVELLGEIPYNMDFASSYAKGEVKTEVIPRDISMAFKGIVQSLKEKIDEGNHGS